MLIRSSSFFPSCSPLRGHVMLRDFLFLTGVTMETGELKVKRSRCVRRTGDSECWFPQLGLLSKRTELTTEKGTWEPCAGMRGHSLSDWHTHTARDKRVPLPKQLNATNTAAGHSGSHTFGPPYQSKPANTHACGHTSEHPHSSTSKTAVTIVNSPLNLGPLYLNYISKEAPVWI